MLVKSDILSCIVTVICLSSIIWLESCFEGLCLTASNLLCLRERLLILPQIEPTKHLLQREHESTAIVRLSTIRAG